MEHQRHVMSQTLKKLEDEIGNLDSRRDEARIIQDQINSLNAKRDEALGIVRELAKIKAELEILAPKKASLEMEVKRLAAESELAQKEVSELKHRTAETGWRLTMPPRKWKICVIVKMNWMKKLRN